MGLPDEELPFILLLFSPKPKTGTLLGLPNGETIGEALGVIGVLGVPGVSVSELTAEVIVRGLEGEARDSEDTDPANVEAMEGVNSCLSSAVSI